MKLNIQDGQWLDQVTGKHISIEQAVQKVIESLPSTDIPLAPEKNVSLGKVFKMADFVVMDTETTGLDKYAEICEISIVDKNGTVLLDTFVKPKRPIPADAIAIHGITNEMVKDAPTFLEIRDQVLSLLAGRYVIIYNADYDTRLLHQSCKAWKASEIDWYESSEFCCAMKPFAKIYNQWDSYRNSYKWQKLETACEYYGITNRHPHRSLGDTLATLDLLKAMFAVSE